MQNFFNALRLRNSLKPGNLYQRLGAGMVACLAFVQLTGCARVYYVGDEFAPTETVDFYYGEDAIDKPYDLIGHGLGSGFFVRTRKIKSKLIEEAKSRGADAVLLQGLGKSKVIIGQLNADERQMNAVFLRYR